MCLRCANPNPKSRINFAARATNECCNVSRNHTKGIQTGQHFFSILLG